jgi:hypothetical protein
MRCIAKHIVVLLALASVALAQDGTFSASTDRTSVGTGEQFTLSFTATGSSVNDLKNFRPPSLTPFVVMSGPNQSTSVQVVNGQMSGSIVYTCYLYARQAGKYTIGQATVEYKGSTLRTQPIQIEVVQRKTQAQPKESDAPQDVAENLFIRAIPDKQRIRQGEPVSITYKLYTRLQVSGYDIARAPVYQGFWAEEIEQPKQPAITAEMYGGKQFRVAVIRKTALFPTQSGHLTISPLEVRCAFQMQSKRKSNDPFDSFFNDPFFSRLQTIEQDFKSNPLTITVEPLPGNAPAGFSGAVGRFTFNATVDKREVKTGDPITLRFMISGSGNVKLLTPPRPVLPADFEAYEPKVSEEISRDGGVIRGKKTAEYLVIARNAGTRVIEPVAFSYFDLEKNAYSVLRSPRFEFTVSPGKDMSAGAAVASKSDIRLLGEDIRYLKLSHGELLYLGESPFSDAWFSVLISFPPIAFIGALIYRKRREKLSGMADQLRSAKAGREATRRLRQAKKLLSQGNTESYHAEILNAVMEYLEDKLRISKSSLTVDEAAGRLSQHGISEQMVLSLRSCIERAEFARFAPSSDTQEARIELLDTAAGVINAVEKSFRR